MTRFLKALGIKKFLIGLALLIIALVLLLNIGNDKENVVNEDTYLYTETLDISRTYIDLRLKTDKVLTQASTYPDYATWDAEMTKLLNDWEDLELRAGLLEEQTNFEDVEEMSLHILHTTQAYTKDEISNVFDKAQAGKKIRTLAKYLGVDAKRAFKILKADQDFVKADAWNEAGDTFKKLEVSAIVIKDGCKVAGFVGAMAISGGAVSVGGVGAGLTAGTATAGEAAILVVTGTDLMLEIGEDSATIALGDKHKAVRSVSNMRSITDPAASILSIKDIPKNVSKLATKLDKVGVVLIQVDQARSMIQDGKLLGINISPDSKKIEAAPLEETEVQEWIEAHKENDGESNEDLTDWLDDFENIDDWLEEFDNEIQIEIDDDEEDKQDKDENAKEEKNENKEMSEKVHEDNNEDSSDGKVYGKDGNSYAMIISPQEYLLISGGAQSWKAEIAGYESSGDVDHQCYWTWYVDDEKKWENLMSCNSTRPIPWTSGDLKVEMRVEFTKTRYEKVPGDYNPGDIIETERIIDIIDTIIVEKNYVILPTPTDTHVYGQ